jgi:tryptophanyl-tRNA synthetase
MSRILTGIQSTNIPHLGNILGAIVPALEMSEKYNESLFFIADLHTLTSRKEPDFIRESTRAVAATWLSFGLDTSRSIFYRQSRVPQVTELTWYLNCFTPYPMLANAHSFKDKSDHLSDVNAGLFTYPVLMAADILLYDAGFVPVGKDQQQHLEIAADIAAAANHRTGQELFIIPQAVMDGRVMLIPGTDGRKMSKSYNNFINIFLPEKDLRKVVMSIKTDSRKVDEPKDPEGDTVFTLYSKIAGDDAVSDMRTKYLEGRIGYGAAKEALFEAILSRFAAQRKSYSELMSQPAYLEEQLAEGERRAAEMADRKLNEVRVALGYR